MTRWCCPRRRPQCSSRSQRALGVDDAFAQLGESPTQRVVQEHLMPMSVPVNPGSTAAPLDCQAQSEDGHGEVRFHENGVTTGASTLSRPRY